MSRTRLLATLLALCLIPGPLLAKGLDPEAAADQRVEINNARPSSPRAAIEHLTRAGEEYGDPELFLLAAQLALGEAERSRDTQLAQQARARALVSRDIALYLADDKNYAATDWRPVTLERAAELAELARSLASEAEQLEETILAERAAAEAEARRRAAAEAEPQAREWRPGTGLIIAGSAALTVGVGGLGMVGAGIAIGQARQRDADALLPGQFDELQELDRQGAQANAIAYAGIGVATLGLAVGAALIVVGSKKRKAAGGGKESALRVGGWVDRETGGLIVGGRF
ncbi:MAG: hypothetical protein R6X02_21840 [Enhygromyxa sp.]